MLGILPKLIDLVTAALPSFNYQVRRKRSFARTLLRLHYSLTELEANGAHLMACVQIAGMSAVVEPVLREQARLLRQVLSTLRMEPLWREALAVHAVDLGELEEACSEKQVSLMLYYRRTRERAEPTTLPDEQLAEMAQAELRKVATGREEIRSFLLSNFTPDDVL